MSHHASEASRSTVLRLTLLLLLVPFILGQRPARGPITVEWAWAAQAAEVFVMERCTIRGQRCVMTPVATLPLTARTWTDTAVLPQREYCYRLAAMTEGQLGPMSNTACSAEKG